MEKTNISKIIESLSGLKHHEWKSIESAVNREFDAMSNRLELTDVSKIQKMVLNEMIHKEYEATKKCSPYESAKTK
ncbi:hypothetical protein AALA46_28720 [Enterocloster aldenensis]|uniref:hypothetical protein n=1 Tax=Enterocloster aldenensis TaxID=358742 RepID=UPI00351722F1